MAAEGLPRHSSDLAAKTAALASDVPKDKSKKGPSFLSRLNIRGTKKKDAGDLDSDSELGSEIRMDGVNAHVFSQVLSRPLAGGGYVPIHKEPPRYIRTRANYKKTREFNRMFLAQELIGTKPLQKNDGAAPAEDGKTPTVTVSMASANGRKLTKTGGAIWATEFSKDGKYLAAAGRDHVVRIWAVISTPEERRAHEEEEVANGGSGQRLSAPVFRNQPIRELQGHTGEVLDLSWSKNNFLLSSSMDKTVRLWHISRAECLCTFKHKDFVTRLAFHPRDDRFFLAGSLDTMLRLWSIPDKAIAFSVQLPDLVTAVAFSPDGKTAIAGLLNGLCLFYDTEGLKFHTQIHVRSSRGKNAKGSKITGIQTMVIPQPNHTHLPSSRAPSITSTSRASTDLGRHGEIRVLITSNDSRIRIYSLRDKSLEIKLKGHDNACSQIAASFSDDGNYVICGSEDQKAFIWSLTGEDTATQDKDKSPCEFFEAHGDIVTTALFAPTKTRMLLGQSGDPIYDLCNPPPVTLLSLEEAASAAASQLALGSSEVPQTPALSEAITKGPEPSPAYIARSTHYDGNIIVTTDDSGIIKVFRQDCAYAKRRHESWDAGSTFSRKLNTHNGAFVGGGLGRSVSVLTRTSGGSAAHSRRGSLSQSMGAIQMGSPQLGAIGVVGPSSDRILSWRQDIENGGNRRTSATTQNGGGTPARSERSLSPTKASRTPLSSSAINLASDARKQPYAGSSPAANRIHSTVTSPTTSVFSSKTPDMLAARAPKEKDRKEVKVVKEKEKVKPPPPEEPKEEEEVGLPTPSFTFRPADDDDDHLRLDPAGASYSFWNLNRWRGITGFRNSLTGQGISGHSRTASSGSPGSKSRSQLVDVSSDERDTDKDVKDKASRRQSVGGMLGSKSGENIISDRRKSLPQSALGRGEDSQSDVRSIPRINPPSGGEENLTQNPVQLRRDGSPYRHLWSRGNSLVSRLSSELSSDIEEEEGENADEELKCKKCGAGAFKARRIAGRQRLSCGRCGTLVDE
ncbi:WD40-repeat-containing domain protein [Podospora didyma]|uniref:WD40-repeat-containing domain protein n=1 Tax=Podospora didyma TaxID=330526 RepID=A0AAE0KDI6_9PEZI|nr:WD40-repeat-containing domain protein [Podospora didyma]